MYVSLYRSIKPFTKWFSRFILSAMCTCPLANEIFIYIAMSLYFYLLRNSAHTIMHVYPFIMHAWYNFYRVYKMATLQFWTYQDQQTLCIYVYILTKTCADSCLPQRSPGIVSPYWFSLKPYPWLNGQECCSIRLGQADGLFRSSRTPRGHHAPCPKLTRPFRLEGGIGKFMRPLQ